MKVKKKKWKSFGGIMLKYEFRARAKCVRPPREKWKKEIEDFTILFQSNVWKIMILYIHFALQIIIYFRWNANGNSKYVFEHEFYDSIWLDILRVRLCARLVLRSMYYILVAHQFNKIWKIFFTIFRSFHSYAWSKGKSRTYNRMLNDSSWIFHLCRAKMKRI